jgi:UDP-glucose 4-epimerase
VSVARLFNTVGPRQTGRYGMVLPRLIAQAVSSEPLTVYGDGLQTRCFCHVADVIESLVRLQNCPAARGEVINIGNDQPISILELAREVIRKTGSNSSIETVPYDQAYEAGFEDMRNRRPAVAKLERLIGFRPRRPLEDIIDEMLRA